MGVSDCIEQFISAKPGLRAGQIAAELGLERSHVIAALHELLGVTQDNAYRWWPKLRPTAPQPGTKRSFLADLCGYYLECLARESGPAISIPAADTAGYAALDALPFAGDFAHLTANAPAIRKLVQKARRESGQLTLYAGYAIRVRQLRRGDEEETRFEPVLLYPIEDTPEGLAPATHIPLFNLEVLKSLPTADSGNLIDEAIQLVEELGLANPEDEAPPWDEIILRLQRQRPDWEWREDLDPWSLSREPGMSQLTQPGIYNRALLFAGARSPFTWGLETELRKLMASEPATHDTALGPWLRGEIAEAPLVEDRPLIEILPLNAEQRQAVIQGLTAPLTIVTGPPGTGKSQVVASLLANMAWQGRSVLLTSKNNHAVDVVENRVNRLGAYPLLLRLGKEEHQARIAQGLVSRLAECSTEADSLRFDRLLAAHEEHRERFASMQQEIAATVELRNQADRQERAAEPARAWFDKERFSALRTADLDAAARRLATLAAALDAKTVRLLENRWRQRVDRAADALRGDAALLGAALPPRDSEGGEWDEFQTSMLRRLEWARRAQDYWRAFARLRAARPIAQLSQELMRIASGSAGSSRELWQSWLELWPSRWNPETRRLLSEYVSLLQMIAGGGSEQPAGQRVFRRYYSLFPKVVKALPCWAVTSLSARGRLPFEPALFDLVIIDEASQCDIASALPLLFRARRAVIIGDPLQLRHVSTVGPQQDQQILAAHGLAEGHGAWAYSVNSLFDVARTVCRHEDIVNLREHHRSHRDIIGFSNRHFYRGRLRIATDRDASKNDAAVRWIDVKGRVMRPSGGGAVNPIEAAAIVKELRTLVIEEGYRGAAGVVTPFRAQANRIRALIHQQEDLAQRLAELRFIADTVHGFQGDERDIVFFSPVVSQGTRETTLRFLNNNGNLFNVAITRARSRLIVVGDMRAALASGVSYLASFAEYASEVATKEKPFPSAAEAGPDYPAVPRPELVSEWERLFYSRLYEAGLRPVPQYEEGPCTLDFALFDGSRKLDIEIDGENYHRDWDGELCRRDQLRSQRLADSGWDVIRFWVYEVRDDPDEAIARVKAWMSAGQDRTAVIANIR
jgi:very-short-patch-repair endonuclease